MIERGREANLFTKTSKERSGSRQASSEQFQEQHSEFGQEEEIGAEDQTVKLTQAEMDEIYARTVNTDLNRRTPRRAASKASTGPSATPAPPPADTTSLETVAPEPTSTKRKATDSPYEPPTSSAKKQTKSTKSSKYPLVKKPDGSVTVMTVPSPPKARSRRSRPVSSPHTPTPGGSRPGTVMLPNPLNMGLGQQQDTAAYQMAASQATMADFGNRPLYNTSSVRDTFPQQGYGQQMRSYQETQFDPRQSRHLPTPSPSSRYPAVDPQLGNLLLPESATGFDNNAPWYPQTQDQFSAEGQLQDQDLFRLMGGDGGEAEEHENDRLARVRGLRPGQVRRRHPEPEW